MKILIYLLITFTLFFSRVSADEGMWIPLFLGELNEVQMQAMGMKITAEDIYSENQSSLKDAIVLFGRGCTAQLISPEGLILTNHHCGNGIIQAISSLENDYLNDGFWAMNRSEELSGPGLKVTFLIRMEEVTNQVLSGIEYNMNENTRAEIIANNIKAVKEAAVKETHYAAEVKSFFYNNRYFLFVNEIFEDVRLVGAPPSNIGNFGGDTDNWVWPRHTGDFSLFRIYADSSNRPAKYSDKNIPYKPKKYLTVSARGVKENDFTFVFGYPGSTQQYIPSFAIDMQVNVLNPVRIGMRQKRLDIYNTAMNESREVRIQYTAKRSGIANGWKKSIGESRGIVRLKTIQNKKLFEEEFLQWVIESDKTKMEYGGLISQLEAAYKDLSPLNYKANYLRESVLSIEIISYARTFADLVEMSKDKNKPDEEILKITEKLKKAAVSHFKNYQPLIDKQIFIAMIKAYYENNERKDMPEIITGLYDKYKGNYELMANDLFERSIFTTGERVAEFLNKYKVKNHKTIEKDPAFKIAREVTQYYSANLLPKMIRLDASIDSLMRIYMKAQMEMQPMKKFYPDANLTLRVTYGNVKGYQPDDAVRYRYFTTLEGIMEKEDPDIYDYVVDEKLKELFKTKDYGPYGDKDGSMHTCFIASNHTSGGNSGSPVLDANGNLIGLNFDRCWEGTMSDLDYDISQCRNIALDVRYCLFIIDKFAGAKHLIDEMDILYSD